MDYEEGRRVASAEEDGDEEASVEEKGNGENGGWQRRKKLVEWILALI